MEATPTEEHAQGIASSTISRDVADHSLAVTRSRQIAKANWPRPTKDED